MTTKRIPLCQTRGCKHANDPDWHIPVCGHGLAYEHHHTTKRSRGGALSVQVCICPGCHHQIDNGPWMDGVYDHKDGTVHYFIKDAKGEDKCDVVIGQWKKGGEQCERIIEAAPTGLRATVGEYGLTGARLSETVSRETLPAIQDEGQASPPQEIPSLESVPDEQLAALFAEADKRQAEEFLLKCRIVHTFRERHVQAWGSSWTESAYELFHISRRTLNAYANLHEICDTADPYLVENIGPLTDSRNLMSLIGRKKPEDGKRILEAAVAYLAKYAEAPTVPALLHQMGEEAKPPEGCPRASDGQHHWTCELCGKEK